MYQVLKDFKGSPDGRFAVDYKAGEVVELTTTLAVVAMAEGWVKPVWGEPAAETNQSADAPADTAAAPPASAPARRRKKSAPPTTTETERTAS